MVDVLAASFPERMREWAPVLERLAPSPLSARALGPAELADTLTRVRRTLGLAA
jgi:malate dehydrogenase (quinone)